MAEEKKPKERQDKYNEKLKVNATFGQVIRVALGKKDEVKKEIVNKKP